MPGTNRARGAVLIVILGVLLVVSVLGTTFVTLSAVDRTVSRSYLDDVRARLLAQSGLEFALQDIQTRFLDQSLASAGVVPWKYYGDDVTEDLVAEANESVLRSAPLEWAQNPSYAAESESPFNPLDASVTPKKLRMRRPDGSLADVGFSGTHHSSSYDPTGDVYSLRLLDCSGMIYVNDGFYLYGGNQSSVSQNLKRILNNLGDRPEIGVAGLGDLLLQKRAYPYQTKNDLLKAVNYDYALFDKIKNYVTTHAWVDKNVVNPVPLSAGMAAQYPISYYRNSSAEPGGIYRRGRGKNFKSEDRFDAEPLSWIGSGTTSATSGAIYALDELAPSYIEVVWRAPVNVNSAEEPVLVALLEGLSGFFHVERRRDTPAQTSPADFPYTAHLWLPPAHQFTVPRDFYTWEYMGHTFDQSDWSAPTQIDEYRSWYWPGPDNGVWHQAQVSTKPATDADEIGFLYRTPVIPATSATTGSTAPAAGPDAVLIAREIIKCRGRQGPYLNLPFGGPFRSWAQFNEFCDYLAQNGTLQDNVNPYWDHDPASGQPIPSSSQQALAAQAIADVLKANFNPNLHLNEMNPDRNIFTSVDKTDLISNSTEFCFLPSGYFEIESLGRVLRPESSPSSSGSTVSAGSGGPTTYSIVAEKKIRAFVKGFDRYRESTQRHFYLGSATDPVASSGQPFPNLMHSLEVGPEPDNGPLVYTDHYGNITSLANTTIDGYAGYAPGFAQQLTGWGYEYEGYLALSTLGGQGIKKPKGVMMEAPESPGKEPPLGDALHAHFEFDPHAHKHASTQFQGSSDFRLEMASRLQEGNAIVLITKKEYVPGACTYTEVTTEYEYPQIELTANAPDRGETFLPPYGPINGSKFRLARSFRLPLASGSGATTSSLPLDLLPFAPSDLRLDGTYSERHSAPAFWLDENQSFNTRQGTISVWIKPSFLPEQSGKVRKVIGVSRWHRKNYYHRNPSPFDLFFFPAHDAPAGAASSTEAKSPAFSGSPVPKIPLEINGAKGLKFWRPSCLGAVIAYQSFDGYRWDYEWEPTIPPYPFGARGVESYTLTPTLNHRWHPGESGKLSPLSDHRWTHVSLAWRVQDYQAKHTLEILVNGQSLPGTFHADPPSLFNSLLTNLPAEFSHSSMLDPGSQRIIMTTLRLGENTTHGFDVFPRNHPADMTFDELHAWTNYTTGKNDAYSLWKSGRYYKPAWKNFQDAHFTSPQLFLAGGSPPRSLAPPSGAAAPVSTGSTGASTGTTTTASTAIAGSAERLQLLGVSWTWYAEDYASGASGTMTGSSATLIPIMRDYKNPAAPVDLTQPDPCCRVFIEAKGALHPINNAGGFVNDGFSRITDADGNAPVLDFTDPLRYHVWFQIKGIQADSVLLATPIFDDLTVFFTVGGPRVLETHYE